MKIKNSIIIILALLVVVGLDQYIKYLVVNHMALGEEISLLPFLSLYHARNPGIAFSMLSSFSDWGLIFLSLVVIVFVAYLWKKSPSNKILARLGFLLVIGGAIGNIIDRLRFHYVIDYISIYIENVFYFAIFNLADAFITIGAIFIIIDEILTAIKQNRQK